jgi:hypothetical protein
MALPRLNTTVVTRDCGTVPVYLQPLVDLRQGNAAVPITDITGRLTVQTNIFVGGLKYEDFAMRRKAETFQHKGNSNKESQKTLFSKMQYRKVMKNIDRINSCPVLVYPPSNSGVKDVMFSGYFFNKNVPYRPSI